MEERKGENEKRESRERVRIKVQGKEGWERKSAVEGARRTEKLRKYALERSVSFAISRACIRLDAHQVVPRVSKRGVRRAERYGKLTKPTRRGRLPVEGHANLARLGVNEAVENGQ